MDYTNNFDDNKHPDETNYEYLLDLYGAIGLRRNLRHPSMTTSTKTRTSVPEHIRQAMKHEVQKLERRLDNDGHHDGWSLLHRTLHGEAHEKDLGEGYKVRVHMLLSNNA